MAYFIDVPTFSDERGKLTVIEDTLLFPIRRVYFIYEAKGIRGGHRHKKTIQGLVCVSGSCEVHSDNGTGMTVYSLNSPNRVLILEPQDWHIMTSFSPGTVLVVFASQGYDPEDYIDEPHKH